MAILLAAMSLESRKGEHIRLTRVYGQLCIETLHESRKWKSNGLSCVFEQENKMSKLYINK